MRWVLRPVLAALAVLGAIAPSSAQDLPRGEILESVTTLADPAQRYAIYLPSTYTPTRPWPVLIGLHPAARGRAIVETYRDAAERFGFIVVGSNNARNGPWEVSLRAGNAVLQDVGSRCAVNPRRVYLTGHSGGARVALQFAIANQLIAGVIASSAGFADAKPRASVGFPIFATAGVEDFNYLEVRTLARTLKTPHHLATFDGGHTLPPAAVAMQAIGWLELQAMASGLRVKDQALIDQLWATDERAIADAGETAAAARLLRAMADDYRALRDVAALESRAARLLMEKDVKRDVDRDRDDLKQESRTLDEFTRLHRGLADQTSRAESLQGLTRLLTALADEANAPDSSPERARARRVLRLVAMDARDGAQDTQYLELVRKYRAP